MKKEIKKTGELKKRAELTTSQLIIAIILIVSFVIILLLWASFNWNPVVNSETCHESIVLRSSVNYGIIQASNVVPLKCQTNKVCLTMSGNNCEGLPIDKQNPPTKVKLSNNNVTAKKQIVDQITNSLIECNTMLGEGKLQFMPKGWNEWNYCLICDRFVLDEQAKKLVPDIAYSEIYYALSQKKSPDGRTYLEYLYPGFTDWRKSRDIFDAMKLPANDPNGKLKDVTFENWKVPLDKDGFIIGGGIMTSQSMFKGSLYLVGGLVAGLAIATLFPLSIPGIIAGVAVIAAGGTAGGLAWVVQVPNQDYKYMVPTVMPYDLDSLRNLKCNSFETAP